MKVEFWRNSAAAILAAGLLAVAAVAQTGEASGEVKIEGDKPPAATTSVQAKPAARPAKPVITDRDPFVNQVESGVVVGGAVPSGVVRSARATGASTVRPAAAPVGKPMGAGKKAAAEAEPEPEVIIPAPEVTVTGIIKSSGSHQAIVSSSTGSYIVSPGQKLGDYRVSAITDTAVTFTHTGKSFKIPIESDFGLKK
jgi:hypothetical protein